MANTAPVAAGARKRPTSSRVRAVAGSRSSGWRARPSWMRRAAVAAAPSTTPPPNAVSAIQPPTEGMRRAIAAAEVGDEQRSLDPTVTALQERVAELLGHETGLFLPSGTMCNEIALRLHIRPGGDEVLLDRTAHPIVAEAGGPAALAGAMLKQLDGDGGIFSAEQVEQALHAPGERYAPRSRLVSVEQTTNMGG